MRLEHVIELVKHKLIGTSISTADYDDHKELIDATVRATLLSLGPAGLGLDNYGEIYKCQEVKPRDDRNVHWGGGKKRR